MRASAVAFVAVVLLAGCSTGDDETLSLAEAHATITAVNGYESLTETEVDDLATQWCDNLRAGGRDAAERMTADLGDDPETIANSVTVLSTMTQYGCPELGEQLQSQQD